LILADTSVWVDHLRSGSPQMRRLLGQGQILIHPFVIAELALGSLGDRTRTLALLDRLPQVQVAQLSEVRALIEARTLYALGIGVVDAHLIASVLISAPALLWTRDKRLRLVAENMALHANLP
jgi:predicted nucleic acid-binding protein